MNNCFTFIGKKPSMRQCIAAAAKLAKPGIDSIELQWGENWLQLQKTGDYWSGFGFLRDIDAAIVARELNHKGAAHV